MKQNFEGCDWKTNLIKKMMKKTNNNEKNEN